jgi:hypothetical protein
VGSRIESPAAAIAAQLHHQIGLAGHRRLVRGQPGAATLSGLARIPQQE